MTDPMPALRLVSHHLCPYVQRAVIALAEKAVAHERTYIDFAKPDWFRAISPLGKVPVLLVGEGTALFENAVICKFLEETAPGVRLHPENPVERARRRGWIEFASATLSGIARFYTAPDAEVFEGRRTELAGKMAWMERALVVRSSRSSPERQVNRSTKQRLVGRIRRFYPSDSTH